MLWRLALIVAACACAACADFPAQVDQPEVLGPALERFQVSGRLSLRQGERSDHLGFDWQHGPETDRVVFLSPVGQGLAELDRSSGHALLRIPGQADQAASDLATLVQRVFGSPLPLEELSAWLGGARPGMHGEADGWRIDVVESAAYSERRLPRRIEIRRADVELKIVITSWGDND